MEHRHGTWSLKATTHRVPGGVVIALRGRIGTVTATSLAAALASARAEAPRLVVDLEGVDYISGPGIAALREIASPEAGQAILCGLREPVRITLELAGLLESVSIQPTRAAAVQSLSAPPASPRQERPPRSS